MKKRRIEVYRISDGEFLPSKRLSSTARVVTVEGKTIVQKTVKGMRGAEVTVLFSSPKPTKATAKRISSIIATPITEEQRMRAAKLADKANAAKKSSVTARFRKA